MTILEALKKGKIVKTRGGQEVRFIALLSKEIPFPLVVGVIRNVGDDPYRMENYTVNGKYGFGADTSMDLTLNHWQN